MHGERSVEDPAAARSGWALVTLFLIGVTLVAATTEVFAWAGSGLWPLVTWKALFKPETLVR